jgi:hypothetical protein
MDLKMFGNFRKSKEYKNFAVEHDIYVSDTSNASIEIPNKRYVCEKKRTRDRPQVIKSKYNQKHVDTVYGASPLADYFIQISPNTSSI